MELRQATIVSASLRCAKLLLSLDLQIAPASHLATATHRRSRIPYSAHSRAHLNHIDPYFVDRTHIVTMSFLTSRSLAISPRAAGVRSFSSSPISRIARMTVVGRLAAQPELFTAQSGQEIIRYAIGTSSGPPDKRETSWWKVASFVSDNNNSNNSMKDRMMSLGKGYVTAHGIHTRGRRGTRSSRSDDTRDCACG
jgi:hypothetical protein